MSSQPPQYPSPGGYPPPTPYPQPPPGSAYPPYAQQAPYSVPGPVPQQPLPAVPLYAVCPDMMLCPRCNQYAAKKVTFTWWGGMLGPRMFNHHKCQECGFGFNGNTGQSNDTAITLYVVISGVIAAVIGVLIFVG